MTKSAAGQVVHYSCARRNALALDKMEEWRLAACFQLFDGPIGHGLGSDAGVPCDSRFVEVLKAPVHYRDQMSHLMRQAPPVAMATVDR